mmetsp:Transcript_30663/g.64162  ORF Transcript_30663/g.64162 Transcript_30663/m.64162 type:complete len:244 (-) Transcript_30663:144-875(-)
MLDVRHKQVTPIRLAHNQPHLSVRFHHLALTDMRVSVHDPRDHFPYYFIQNLNIRICLNRALDRLEVGELLKNRGLGDDSLVDEAANGDHGKAGVLDLSKAVPVEGGLILGEVERVEREVTRGALALEGLEEGNYTEQLNERDPENDLLATALGDEVIVGVDGGELGEEREGVNLLDNESEDSEHSEAAVLELSLTQNAEIENIGEAQGIEANVAGQGTIQVGRALEEGNGRGEIALHLETAG